jgi:hypothetical protein
MLLSIIVWRVLTGVKFLRKSWPRCHRSSVQVCDQRCFHSTLSVATVSVVLLVGLEWLEEVYSYFILMDSMALKTCLLFNTCTFLHICTLTKLTPRDSSKT